MTSSLLGPVCPSCRVALVISERQGIEIDYCPQCRGVWLDRGELDKIIERVGADAAQARPAAFSQPRQGRGHDDDSRSQGQPYQKRKKSFFEELFD